MAPRPLDTEPVRTAGAVGALGGSGILATVLQTAAGVDWNSAVDVLTATGPGVAGVAAAVAAAAGGRKRASIATTVAKEKVHAHQQGINGQPLTDD